MPTVSPTLDLGLQTLAEVIQITPASPGLAIITTSRNILQMISVSYIKVNLGWPTIYFRLLQRFQDDRSGHRDEQRLAQKVLEIALAYSDGVKRLDETDSKDGEIVRISINLHSCLDSIVNALLNKPKPGFFSRLLKQSATQQRIKGLEGDLEHIAFRLATHMQLQNVKISQAIMSASDKNAKHEIPTMEERIQQANQETLDLIKLQVLKQTRKKLHKSSFGHFPPATSPIFYGRSPQLEMLVASLVKVPAYHAILGPGGIGKTSVALNVLHDPRIVQVYGKHRYFLACETTSDAGGIVAGMADIFSLNEGTFVKSFKGLCEVIQSNILFLLDNFETPWERLETRQRVEDLLTDLSSIPNLSIIITLRGAERPCGVQWSPPFLPVLGPLDLSAACQIFGTIADTLPDDPDVAGLMEAVEFVPLAITLLAAQASYTSCAFLIEQWQTRKTSMITRGFDTRLSSLDVSISLSLTSSRFIGNPHALPLLQILSLLPDGATLEELQQMTPEDVDIHAAVSTLLQVAIASVARQDRVRVLVPIREYVQSKHPISPTLLQPVLSYHAKLSRYAGESEWTAESKNVDDMLQPCIGNIHYVIRICLDVPTLADEAINAGINVSSFRRTSRFGSIGHLLDKSVKVAREGRKWTLLAVCLQKMGVRMWFSTYERPLALGCLEESADILRHLQTPERHDLLVTTLYYLSWYMTMMWRKEEGLRIAQEAVSLIASSTSSLISAMGYMRLGYCLMLNGRFPESRSALEHAGSYFESTSSPPLSLRLSESYTNMYLLRDMYRPALNAATMSLSLPTMVDSDTELGQHLTERGRIWHNMSQFENARRDFSDAIQYLASSGSAAYMSRTYCCLGLTYIACGDFENAELAIQTASQFHQRDAVDSLLTLAILRLYQNDLEQSLLCMNTSFKELSISGFSLTSPAYFFRLAIRCQIQIQEKAQDALPSCVLAVITAHKSQDRGYIAASLLWLGDAYLHVQKDVSASEACYQAHLNLVRYLGNWRWVACALMRLGVAEYFQGDTPLAVRRLNQAARLYEETGGKTWVEFCKKALMAIEGRADLENIPIFPPVSSFGF